MVQAQIERCERAGRVAGLQMDLDEQFAQVDLARILFERRFGESTRFVDLAGPEGQIGRESKRANVAGRPSADRPGPPALRTSCPKPREDG